MLELDKAELENRLEYYKMYKISIENLNADIEHILEHDALENEAELIRLEEAKAKTSDILKDMDSSLDKLPEAQRQIIRSYYVEGESWNIVSDKAGYSERHCKRLRSQALSSILEDMKQQESH